ncbi:MAG: prepilin-type N-terminal cleavage/methylation domain-containing protein [Candidatus Ozemobacteraceae bacterium]
MQKNLSISREWANPRTSACSSGKTRAALRGFTLVETIIALAVALLLIGLTWTLFRQYRIAFQRGGQYAENLRESALFVEYLRTDLLSAVPPSGELATVTQGVFCTNEPQKELSFSVFSDDKGTLERVTYTCYGSAIRRSTDNGFSRMLVTNTLRSLSWKIVTDGPAATSPGKTANGRWGIFLDAVFAPPAETGQTSAEIHIQTHLFPVRWCRSLQRKPSRLLALHDSSNVIDR